MTSGLAVMDIALPIFHKVQMKLSIFNVVKVNDYVPLMICSRRTLIVLWSLSVRHCWLHLIRLQV